MVVNENLKSPSAINLEHKSSSFRTWMMLFIRIGLFAGLQALFALGFYITKIEGAWEAGANWWPLVVTITNLICIVLLVRLYQAEGKRFWDIFRIDRANFKTDLLALIGTTLVLGPVGLLPNIWLGGLLFDDPQRSLDLLVRPLPMWAVVTSLVAFPLTQGITELATYFNYVMPRLEKHEMPGWLAVSLPAMLLGFQHCALPLLFDLPFFTWRLLMYVPFAFLIGIILHWRPRMLPYLAVIHILMDASLAAMLLEVAI